jgi:ABC-type transport system involved in multi-copper enzyme maturation permease subunit
MKLRWPRFGLPLLSRELAEQSAHARHYALRCLCAIVIFGIGFVAIRDVLVSDEFSGQMLLGRGIVLVDWVTSAQAFLILLFLPAMTCGAIAGEKERNTLAILLTTRLGPLTIILEKLASRLVVVFMLLLLSLPLFAVAYSMGGIGLPDLLSRVTGLVELSLFVASLSLMCSAWCGSTVSAFFMSYFVAGVLVFGAALVAGYSLVFQYGRPGPVAQHVLILACTVFFLTIATRSLISRAFVTSRNFILATFRGLDNLYTRMNVIVGNVVLVREKALLPADKPIAWRETAKKSLGTVRYLVRVLVAIELPTVFLLVSASEGANFELNRGNSVGSFLWFAIWIIAATLIAVSGASIVSGERTRQTLPVLISTPLRGDEIVRELFAGVRRLITVLWIPFATVAGYEFWFHLDSYRVGQATILERLICALAQMAVYPFLIGWMTFYLGTRVRSALWAILGSLFMILTLILLPYAGALAALWMDAHVEWVRVFAYSSPASIVVINEGAGAPLTYTLINFAVFGALTWLMRWHCLRNADRLLGRSETLHVTRSKNAPSQRAFSLPRAPRRHPDASPLVSETAGSIEGDGSCFQAHQNELADREKDSRPL